jgi:hypothetical protein
MQQVKKYILPLLMITAFAASCSKDRSSDPNLPAANYMTATIDGSYWSADEVIRISSGGDTIRFTGSRSNSKPVTIQLVVNKYRGPGTYKLNDTLASAVYTDVNGTYRSYGGTVSVTADDAAHIAAAFQANTQEIVTGTYKDITNGQLNIKK